VAQTLTVAGEVSRFHHVVDVVGITSCVVVDAVYPGSGQQRLAAVRQRDAEWADSVRTGCHRGLSLSARYSQTNDKVQRKTLQQTRTGDMAAISVIALGLRSVVVKQA
jgi:hypothetical protein